MNYLKSVPFGMCLLVLIRSRFLTVPVRWGGQEVSGSVMKSLLLLLSVLSLRTHGARSSYGSSPDRVPVLDLHLDLSSALHRLDPRFLSVTIDASLAAEERSMLLLSRERKRMQKSEKAAVPKTTSCHDYAKSSPTSDMEAFPPLPKTPSKPPAAKKALLAAGQSSSDSNEVIAVLSELINKRADSLELRADSLERLINENSKKIDENTLKIEGIRRSLEFACNEIKDTQKSLKDVDLRLKNEEKTVAALQAQVLELESYSRRWNLKLFGVTESPDEDVKAKVTEICQSIVVEDLQQVFSAIDVTHRLGKPNPSSTRPRAIIIRFSQRSYRDVVWRAAKNSSFLREKKLRFAEDLSTAVREARLKVWPLIQKAREEGKRAYFVGSRAFINGQEVK